MSSNKKQQPNQTTVTPDHDAITPRELTPEEAERVSGGLAGGRASGMSQLASAMSQPTSAD